MRDVLFFTHPSGLIHDPGPGHPEARVRLERILEHVARLDAPWLQRREPPLASLEQLSRAHARPHVEAVIEAEPTPGERVFLDPDTGLVHGSVEAARRASGGAIAAVDALVADDANRAFVAMRPPGHHAESRRAMGFCLFDQAAVAAKHALDHHGLERVAILDFDVHHGNGSQEIAWDDRRIFYGSSHQSPFYPGTGAAGERGAFGQIVNVPLPAGASGGAVRRAWDEVVLPACDAFAPELVVISAGFDAHRADPLANFRLDEADFAHIARAIVALAERRCGGRVLSVLEGGYDPDALARCVVGHLRVLAAEQAAERAIEDGR